MSLFKELKRRNVFRVGIAYAVAAWVLLQLIDVIDEILLLPEWAPRLILTLLVVGIVPALIFAWAFELTPEGIKRESEVDRSQSVAGDTGKKLNTAILVLMALAIAYLLFDKFSVTAPSPESTTAAIAETAGDGLAQAPTGPQIDPKSIAVLPFDNRSKDEDDEFFVEGVHDDLLTNLARIGSLKVISRTSVLRYKDTQKPIPEIALELGVATIMEGAVQRSGEQIRINVQLIDAETDKHLWAEIFDRKMTAENLFAIQSEISEKIAAALKATLSPAEQQRINDRPTENMAAYNAYLRGRQLQSRRNSTDLQQAQLEFQRAVELDPDFALAWVGVADTSNLLTNYSNLGLTESIKTQEHAAGRALALNDQLGEAHVSMAGVHRFYERFDEAEAEYLKGIELSPNYATAYHWYSGLITRSPARWEESLELIQKAISLDPLAPILQMALAGRLRDVGRDREAEQVIENLLQLDPDFAPAYSAMSGLKANLGHFDEAVRWLEKSIATDPGNPHLLPALAFAHANLGNEAEFDRIRKRIEAIDDQHMSLTNLAMIENIYQENYPAAVEAGQWFNKQLGSPPSFQGFFAFVNMMAGKYPEALAAAIAGEPRYAQSQLWSEAIEINAVQSCDVGWLFMVTGEQQKGLDLVNMSLAYLENELPNYTEHADRLGFENCYLAKRENEKALALFETRVDHGHLDFWWTTVRHPLYEPLLGTPRFEAARQTINERLAIQRANLARMETETGP